MKILERNDIEGNGGYKVVFNNALDKKNLNRQFKIQI